MVNASQGLVRTRRGEVGSGPDVAPARPPGRPRQGTFEFKSNLPLSFNAVLPPTRASVTPVVGIACRPATPRVRDRAHDPLRPQVRLLPRPRRADLPRRRRIDDRSGGRDRRLLHLRRRRGRGFRRGRLLRPGARPPAKPAAISPASPESGSATASPSPIGWSCPPSSVKTLSTTHPSLARASRRPRASTTRQPPRARQDALRDALLTGAIRRAGRTAARRRAARRQSDGSAAAPGAPAEVQPAEPSPSPCGWASSVPTPRPRTGA